MEQNTPQGETQAAPEGSTATVEIQAGELRSGRAMIPMDPDAKAAADQAAADAKATKNAPQRPDWIPEKFWTGNLEDSSKKMAQSYGELEKKQSQKPATPPDPKSETPPADKKVDLSTVAQEFEQSGSLSEDTYAKLASAGYDRATVDSHIAGQVALGKQVRGQIAAVVGGEESLTKILDWAKDSLPAEQVAAYNAAAATKNIDLVKLALAGVAQAYNAANPAEPSLISGEPVGGNSGAKPFRSNAEMIEAMQDRRYAKDPAYRADVARRVAVSKL